MNERNRLTAHSIQHTMMIPLYSRAAAGRRFPEILRDHTAERIMAETKADLRGIRTVYDSEYAALLCLLRAERADDRVRDHLGRYPDATVINLGAGLDDTFGRIDNGRVRWYNLDLPDAIAYREQFLPATERSMNLAFSAFDLDWLAEVRVAAETPVLVLANGLFQYFPAVRIRSLVAGLCRRFASGELFFDAGSWFGIWVANQMVRWTGNTGAGMHFWVNRPDTLFEWSPRIVQVEVQTFFSGLPAATRLNPITRFMIWGAKLLGSARLISLRW